MAVVFPGDLVREPSTGELSVCSSPIPNPALNPQDEMRAIARNISDQPLSNPVPGVWAVLTAISKVARLRSQGMNILFFEDDHIIGRCVEDEQFCITSNSISAHHCRIFRKRENHADGKAGSNNPMIVFLKDMSTNGTYLNWAKLRKNSPKARLRHGDIISFVSPPHDENTYAFVYRDVPSSNSEGSKRKFGDFVYECKRLKGIGIGAPDGPISLDDVRSLQRSNTELRRQLESHVLTIEVLQNENRAMNAHHINELKELKEAITNSYLDRIKDLHNSVDAKQIELGNVNSTSSELHNSIKDLNERLSASLQSRADADEIINSQKIIISELEAQLDEERNQRREEREQAEIDLKSAIQKAHLESQEEIRRQSDVYMRQHREQQEFIIKLQESEKESRLLVEMKRSQLEDARESLVTSEKKSRKLEAQFQEEVLNSAISKKKLIAAESQLKKMQKELDSEKVAREEAWAKVASLELEMAAAIRDLSAEKQKFQGARERIILRETQLRAFYSTTEEISSLFSKQQEQLKAMQKTLEDEENYENSLFAVDSNMPHNQYFSTACPRENPRESSGGSTPKNSPSRNCNIDDMSDDDCSTQKHDCQNGSQDGNTQLLDCGSFDGLPRGFGSDINGDRTATVPDLNPAGPERVLGTESQVGDAVFNKRWSALLQCSSLAGETAQIDDDDDDDAKDSHEARADSSNFICSPASRKEGNDASTVRTADLLASEAAGSWAVDTAPSVYCENESPEGRLADAQEAGSQGNSLCGGAKLTKEQQALSAMISIVEPDFKRKFHACVGRAAKSESPADTETEEGSNADDSEGDCNAVDAANGADTMIEDSVS